MNDAEERINQYLSEQNLASTTGAQLILSGAGGLVGFEVTETAVGSVIAGIVGFILESCVIPYIWTNAIKALVNLEYNNIRDYIADANYYFDLS